VAFPTASTSPVESRKRRRERRRRGAKGFGSI